ncbi:unnamed protein product [Bursaphelenchus xylophilus]|uniref:(pine wood nematode) hypothetical protein n=1 Tax=Bursaphelenchus xylophilus TaxID=6326 RepID=A0A1I7S6C6_BURXY|nr:unnamed protein product [Bursaphelenchus xylophilus]CAG9128137.1 unnamed protein product [Bursaphelenchus xylophilus]
MDLYLFKPDDFNRLYNCNLYDTEIFPREERRLRVIGLLCLPPGILSVVLYFVCIYAMLQKQLIKLPTYKLMLFMAFFHLYGCILGGFFIPYLFYEAPVYCESPDFIYLAGAYCTASWIGGTITSTILSFNRCCEMYDHTLAHWLFADYRVFIWMAFPLTLFLYCLFYNRPLLFSGIGMSWYFNPHHKYIDDLDGVYVNKMHTLNNTVTVATQFVLSFTFMVLYFGWVKSHKTRMSRTDKLMCLQVFLIGLLELFAGTTFLLQQHYEFNLAMSLFASISWFGSQACAPYIYLTFNRTVRNIVLRRFLPCCGRKVNFNVSEIPSTFHAKRKNPQ